jgi:hypothetical protein
LFPANERDTAHDVVPSAGELPEHASSFPVISRLAQNGAIDDDGCVGGNHPGSRAPSSNLTSLFKGQAPHVATRAFPATDAFIDLRNVLAKSEAELT